LATTTTPITTTTTPAQHQLQPPPVVVTPLQLLQLHPQVATLQVNALFALFVNKPQLLASHGIHVQSMQQIVADNVQKLQVAAEIQTSCLSCESMDLSGAGGYDGYFKHSSAAAASAAASSGTSPHIICPQHALQSLC